MPTFPLELTDEIIAWIPVVCYREWDKGVLVATQTLLSCCLVCSAWLPASRHHLFREIQIDRSARYDLLVSRVLHSEKMRINLLSVRTVNIMHPDSPALNCRSFVLEFAGHLPNVTLMHFLYGGVEVFLSHPRSFVAISRFSSIQTLMISHDEFPSFGAFRRTLTLLPSLANLMLSRPSWPDPPAGLSPHLSHGASIVGRPALLSVIVVWGPDAPDRRRAQQFVAWLSETATSSSLLHLQATVDSTLGPQIGCMATFGLSLFRFGRVLRRLEIGVGESRDLPELERFFCTLTSLTYLSLLFYSSIQPETWVQMERLVRSLPCPTQLAVLNISVHYDGPPEPLELEGLEALDVALPPELFKGLQSVMLQVQYFKERAVPEEGLALTEPFLAVIRNKLPKLHDRDIIAVFVDGINPAPVLDVEPGTDANAALS